MSNEAHPVALVTGGSRGIGAAIVRTLITEGWDVLFTYRSDVAAAQALTEHHSAAQLASRCAAVPCDVSVEADVLAAFARCDALYGRIDALVNNAGVVDRKIRVDELTVTRIERMFAVNVTGTMLCAREAVRRMSTIHGGQGGAIVNISSAASRIGSPGEYVDYAAAKGAVDTFTVGLALEVVAEGIRVNGVRPGVIDTEIHASGGQPDRAARVAKLIPMQRPGTAQEVANMVAFLCSPKASYMTGAIIDVSGGR